MSLVTHVREVIRKTPSSLLAARVRSMLYLSGSDGTDLRVLYLRGIQDQIVSERVVMKTLAMIPNHVRVNLSAPHLLLQAAPEQAWEAISLFVDSGS
jgi:sigma-B regulation protein RsbQ